MKQWKGFLAGVCCALLAVGLVATAGAKTGTVTQELTYRDIRVSLDGKVLDLRNAIGEPVEPFMFGGTNYLPVRALAEALGLDVAWNGAEVMVVLTTPQPEPTPEPEAPTAEPVAEVVPTAEPENVQAEEAPNKAVVNDCNVEIKTARLLRNYDDALVIVPTIQWTNGKSYAISAAGLLTVKASQNGVELERAYPDGYDSSSCFEQTESGKMSEFENAFLLKDAKAPVEITVFDANKPTENSAKMAFQPSSMNQPASVKSETPVQTVQNDRTVYVTKTGKHYHYSDTCNGGTYYRSTLSEALSRKLTPCDKCVLTGN